MFIDPAIRFSELTLEVVTGRANPLNLVLEVGDLARRDAQLLDGVVPCLLLLPGEDLAICLCSRAQRAVSLDIWGDYPYHPLPHIKFSTFGQAVRKGTVTFRGEVKVTSSISPA